MRAASRAGQHLSVQTFSMPRLCLSWQAPASLVLPYANRDRVVTFKMLGRAVEARTNHLLDAGERIQPRGWRKKRALTSSGRFVQREKTSSWRSTRRDANIGTDLKAPSPARGRW